jgi:hypothetical protein
MAARRQKFVDRVCAGQTSVCKELFGKRTWHMPVALSNIDFSNCTINGAFLTSYVTAERSVMKNVRIKNCKMYGFSGNGAVFEQVEVDGLQTGPKTQMFLSACVFRHTIFKGAIGQVIFRATWGSVTATEEQRQAFRDANADYYRKKKVDWAIDISKMEASCFEIRGAVPAHLIRRNPADQFIIKQEVAAGGKWKKVRGIMSTCIPNEISLFLGTGMPDTVLIAQRRSKSYQEHLVVYERMRDAGFLT